MGQPNSGKSTIFNQVAGFRSLTANFPGTTVEYLSSYVREPEPFIVVDLPGSYSLSSTDDAERETRNFLMRGEADAVINVVDASTLLRGLSLTVELLEMGIPVVLCLNMMDEAKKKGMEINTECLSEFFGVPVVATVATRGENIRELFSIALKVAKEGGKIRRSLKYSRDVERIVEMAEEIVRSSSEELKVSSRFVALKALEGDPEILRRLGREEDIERLRRELESSHGRSADEIIISERHSIALRAFSRCVKVRKDVRRDFSERIDEILTHKYLGFLIAALILYSVFYIVFSVGGLIEERFIEIFGIFSEEILRNFPENSLEYHLTNGVLLGISGGIAIVLPYLIPFLIILSILEDTGYIPRIAFLLDGAFHRIGLHGGAIIPLVLGYGCSVPAVMATRTLGDRKERFLATALAVMIPCSARTVVILGLVGHFMGLHAALAVYLLNVAVVILTGFFLSKTFYGDIYGIIMEIPPLRRPSVKSVIMKTWLRAKEFIYIAFPILIAGSAFLSLIEFYGADELINIIFKPVTALLDLPEEVGTTLIFGILRKELTLIMLAQVMGTYELSSVLTAAQMMSFVVFTTFYVPCLSTIAVMIREVGKRGTLCTILLTSTIATLLGALTRFLMGFYLH
ncbi:MAG: ferrous iron transport protein [Archaeoglobi archaeon]|nr:ferrous iron transport protein [Archaeoglobi archaeon]